jgi:hypothetical protein
MTPDDLQHEALRHSGELPDDMGQARAMLDAIAQAHGEHLTYEQMDAWVEDEMDQTARELVMAHAGLCPFCAKQLTAYESYAPVMSAPVVAPAQLVPFGERLRTSLRWPQFAMIALAIAVVALAPAVMRNARSAGRLARSREQGSGVESLQSLPPSLREAAREVMTADTPLRPAALVDLAPNVDPRIEYPASEVIEETRPELRWKPFAASYSVSISDRGGREAAHATDFAGTQWTASVSLNRGAMYTWEVRAEGSGSADLRHADTGRHVDEVHHADTVHRGMFRVLGDSEEQTLAQLRASGAGPLALGAVAQQFGLLSMAQREFEKLAQDLPRSQDAEKLLEHITSLRGR